MTGESPPHFDLFSKQAHYKHRNLKLPTTKSQVLRRIVFFKQDWQKICSTVLQGYFCWFGGGMGVCGFFWFSMLFCF